MLKYLQETFEQIVVMAPRQGSKAAQEGACHNFSLHWLRLVMEAPRQLARERMNALKKKDGGLNLLFQKVFVERWESDPSTASNADTLVLRLRGMEADKPVIDFEAFSQNRLEKILENPGTGGGVYSFWFKGSVPGAASGAHSIAFYRSGTPGGSKTEGFIYCFDPNFGEFMILQSDFKNGFLILSPITAILLNIH